MHTLSSPQSTRMWACVVQIGIRNNLGKPELHCFSWKVWRIPQIKPKPSFHSAWFCPARHPGRGSDLPIQPHWHNSPIPIHSATSLKKASLAVFWGSQAVLFPLQPKFEQIKSWLHKGKGFWKHGDAVFQATRQGNLPNGMSSCAGMRTKEAGFGLRSQERGPGPDREPTTPDCQGPTCSVTVFSR